MDQVADIARAVYFYGRWGIVLALFTAVVYRNRHGLHPARLAREMVIVVSAYFAYFLVRGSTEGSEAKAIQNAQNVVDFERSLGIYWEPQFQETILNHRALVDAANWAYIWGHWPVIVLVAIWLYANRPATYLTFRNAFMISGAIGLVIFMLFPVAPPRLADLGLVDTVTEHSRAYRVLQPPALTNQYAAVPSLHFGWNMLVGIVLFREARSWPMRAFGIVMPIAMLFSTFLTANHYFVDAAAGAIVALIGLAIAHALASGALESMMSGRSPYERARR